jgi:hypothetical protein
MKSFFVHGLKGLKGFFEMVDDSVELAWREVWV